MLALAFGGKRCPSFVSTVGEIFFSNKSYIATHRRASVAYLGSGGKLVGDCGDLKQLQNGKREGERSLNELTAGCRGAYGDQIEPIVVLLDQETVSSPKILIGFT